MAHAARAAILPMPSTGSAQCSRHVLPRFPKRKWDHLASAGAKHWPYSY